MPMFNSCKEWGSSLIIFDIDIKLKILNHVFNDLEITSGNSKMKWNFPFCLFKLIEHLFQRNILTVWLLFFIVDFLLQIHKEQFQLSNLECSDSVDNLFECCHYLLIFFEFLAFHFSMFFLLSIYLLIGISTIYNFYLHFYQPKNIQRKL